MPDAVLRFFEVTREKPAYGQGFRGALVWGVFLLIGFHTDQVALGVQAGFVGWIVSFCDDSTGRTRRLMGAVILTLIASAATFVATIASTSVIGAVVVTAVLGSISCIAAVGGPASSKKGLVVMFLALFSVGQPGDLSTATDLTVASILGGTLTVVVIALSIPFGRSRNSLRTAAAYFTSCSELAALFAQGASEVAISQSRAAFVRSRQEAYLDVRYTRPIHKRDQLADYLARGSDLTKALVTFYDARRSEQLPMTDATRAMYGAVSRLCAQASSSLASPGLHDLGVVETLAAIDRVSSEINAQPPTKHLGLAVLRHLHRSVAGLLDDPHEGASGSVSLDLGPSTFDKIFVALRYDTPLRRHLLRYVVLMCLATALYKWSDIPDGFFIPIGINIMLQQDFGGAISKLRAYAIGTIVGSAIGAVLGVTLDSLPIALTAATSITLFLMISLTRVTWWAFAVGASVFIVSALGLLVEGGFFLGGWRVFDTLIAAAFVGIGMYTLWPTRAKKLAPTRIAECLSASADYLRFATTGAGAAAAEQRRVVVRATGELSQRINEYAREPGHSSELVTELQSILIDVQLIFGLVTEISRIDLQARADGRPGAAFGLTATRDSVIESLEVVARAFGNNQAVGRLPDITPLPAQTDNQVSGREMVSVGVVAQSMSAHTPVATVSATER